MIQASWTLVACTALTLACSTTSTIVQTNAPTIEGDITGGSPDSIFVESEGGREYEIPRDEVSTIDYPGNVHTGVGVGVLLYGGLNIAVGMPACERRKDDQAAFCTGVFLPAAIGLGMITWGLLVHHGQTSAVADTSHRPTGARAPGSWQPSPVRTAPPSKAIAAPPAAAPGAPSSAPSPSAAPDASTDPAPPPPAPPAAEKP